jgi:hypothetical protein
MYLRDNTFWKCLLLFDSRTEYEEKEEEEDNKRKTYGWLYFPKCYQYIKKNFDTFYMFMKRYFLFKQEHKLQSFKSKVLEK